MPDRLVWTPILEGAEMALLSGDPEMPGSHYVIRFRTSLEIAVPAHWHPEDEHITVLQGPFSLGFGDRFQASALESLAALSYRCVRRELRHFAFYGPGTLIQVNGVGPFRSIYVDPGEALGERIGKFTSR